MAHQKISSYQNSLVANICKSVKERKKINFTFSLTWPFAVNWLCIYLVQWTDPFPKGLFLDLVGGN